MLNRKHPAYTCCRLAVGVLSIVVILLAQPGIPYDITNATMPVSYSQGIPEEIYGISSAENVNLFNGKLSLNLPLFRVASRGDASFTRTLHIQPNWRIDVTPAACQPNCPQGAQEYYEMPVQWSQFRNISVYGPGTLVRVTELGSWAGCVGYNQTWPQRSLTKLFFIDTYGSVTELVDTWSSGADQDARGSCSNQGSDVNRGKIFRARDGSEIYFVAQNNVVDDPTSSSPGSTSIQRPVDGGGHLFFPNGVRYRINDYGLVDQIRDRHGNLSTFEYDPACNISGVNCRLMKAVDSLNRETKFAYDRLTGDGDPPGATSYTLIQYEGAGTSFNSEVRVYYGLLENAFFDQNPDFATVQLYSALFAHDSINWFNYTPNTDKYNPTVAMELRYPNGKSYKIRYNAYAEPTLLDLPTGGKFEYKWDTGCEINTAALPSENWEPRNRCGVLLYRRLTERKAVDHNSILQMHKIFEATDKRPAGPAGSSNLEVLEREFGGPSFNTLLRQSKHVFFGRPSDDSILAEFKSSGWKVGRPLEQHVMEPDDTSRRASYRVWAQRGMEFSTYSESLPTADWREPPNNPRMIRSQEFRADGGESKWKTTEFVFDRFNNHAVTVEHNWTLTQGGYSSRTRARLQRYQYQISPAFVDLAFSAGANTAHLLRSPTLYQVGADANASWNLSGIESQTEYLYDEPAALTTSAPSVKYEDPGAKSRGNVTSIRRWLSATGTWLTHSYKFDKAGNTVEYKNPRLKATTFEYGDNSECVEDNPASGMLAFQTKVTQPHSHDSTRCFDYLTGLAVWEKDPNGVQTRYEHSDPLRRLTSVEYASDVDADRNATRIFYDDSNRTVTSRGGLPDRSSGDAGMTESIVTYDGLGRPTLTQSRVNEGYVYSQKAYDKLGRVDWESFPAYSLGGTARTTYTYDILDRPLTATVNDGTSSSSSTFTHYPDRTDATDPAGKWRTTTYDALGRLVSVTEPSSTTAQPNTAGNWATNYTYDRRDNLLTVTQGAQTRVFQYDSADRLIVAKNPEYRLAGNPSQMGQMSYTYDESGNLLSRTDPNGTTTSFTYDDLDRLTFKNYPGTEPDVTLVYDTGSAGSAIGRLTSVSSAGGTVRSILEFDSLGRVKSSRQSHGSAFFDFSYAYDRLGNLSTIRYPSGRTIRNSYTPGDGTRLSRIDLITSPETPIVQKTYVQITEFAPTGVPQLVQLGSSPAIYQHFRFNGRMQMTDVKVGSGATFASGAASDMLALQLGYGTTNNNGNVLTQVTSFPGQSYAQTYNYDQVSRLCSVRESLGSALPSHGCGDTQGLAAGESWRQAFGYDRYGNKWVAQHLGDHMPYSGLRPTQQTNFDANTNRLMEVANQVTFDAAGQQVRQGAWNLGYDAEGRVQSSENTANGVIATYEYDGEGHRVAKTVGSTVTWFVYDAFGQLAAEYSSAGATGTGGTHYMTTDHLGSTRLVTDGGGAVVSRHDYFPFGEEIGPDVSGRTTIMKYVVTDDPTQRFTGKERDAETGLDYFGARYLSGAQGRFTSPDVPLADQWEKDPQSWNLYSYVRNNPLRFIDPTGRECVTLDNGAVGDNGQGKMCQAVLDADKNKKPDVTVSAMGGNQITAFALNSLFALDAAASSYFRPLTNAMGVRPSYMEPIPVTKEFVGQAAAAAVTVGTAIIGPGGAQAPLKLIHSPATLSKTILDGLRKKSTQELIESLRPGLQEALRVKPDGRVMNGNHRLTVLMERGVDVNTLHREVVP